MPSANPARSVSQAAAKVRRALALWDASNLDRAEAGREILRRAALDLTFAEQSLVKGGVASAAELTPMLVELKHDLKALTRLIDACSAFHRGLLVRLNGSASSYDASGNAVPEGVPAVALQLQG